MIFVFTKQKGITEGSAGILQVFPGLFGNQKDGKGLSPRSSS